MLESIAFSHLCSRNGQTQHVYEKQGKLSKPLLGLCGQSCPLVCVRGTLCVLCTVVSECGMLTVSGAAVLSEEWECAICRSNAVQKAEGAVLREEWECAMLTVSGWRGVWPVSWWQLC